MSNSTLHRSLECLPFRDLDQRLAVCRLLARAAGDEAAWTERGPTVERVRREPAPFDGWAEDAFSRLALAVWSAPRADGDGFSAAELLRAPSLVRRVVAGLLEAFADGPEGIDRWLEQAPVRLVADDPSPSD